MAAKKIFALEPSCQNISCSECQQDVRNQYPRKVRKAKPGNLSSTFRRQEDTQIRKTHQNHDLENGPIYLSKSRFDYNAM